MTNLWKAVTGFIPVKPRKREELERMVEIQGLYGCAVRLLEPLCQSPTNPVERLAVNILRQEGSISFELLVESVVSDLYREELDRGAWTLDIGLLGKGLFARDVVRGLKAGDGILWRIQRPKGEGDELLSDLG